MWVGGSCSSDFESVPTEYKGELNLAGWIGMGLFLVLSSPLKAAVAAPQASRCDDLWARKLVGSSLLVDVNGS